MNTTYRILADRFEAVQIELGKLNKRSSKCGTAGFELVIEKTEIEPISNGEVAVYYLVSIQGETPKLAGYTFISKLDHNNDPTGASNIVYSMPGITLSEADRTRAAYCDHCKCKRFRRDTFLLRRDSDDTIIQVGRSCIKDFIGHNPEQVLQQANSYIKIVDTVTNASSHTFQMHSWRNVSLTTYLEFVAFTIRTCGWVSGRQAYETGKVPTSITAWENMTYQINTSKITDEDRQLAADAIQWAMQQDPKQSDFFHNMVTVANTGYINHKITGIAAAIIPVYTKHLKNSASTNKIDFTKSSFVGKKGDRLTLTATVYGKSTGQGAFGPWTRVSMIDADGNIYVTFASGKFNPEHGSTINIRGTVKEHTIFKNAKQTMLSRVVLR